MTNEQHAALRPLIDRSVSYRLIKADAEAEIKKTGGKVMEHWITYVIAEIEASHAEKELAQMSDRFFAENSQS